MPRVSLSLSDAPSLHIYKASPSYTQRPTAPVAVMHTMTEGASGASQESLPRSLSDGSPESKTSLVPATNVLLRSASSSRSQLADVNATCSRLTELNTENESALGMDKVEGELSEEELRHLFDDEEIERFLGLFANSVSEVALPTVSDEDSHLFHDVFKAEEIQSQLPEPPFLEPCANDWLSIDSSKVPVPSRVPPSASNARCISEHIAFTYLLRMLPPARPRPRRFTMGRLRISIQRLYFVAHPAYREFFSRLTHLATWRNRKESALYCALQLFWVLWYRNMLMPATIFRILCSLLRRRLLPYPTLKELRSRRREAALAEDLSEQIQVRLGTASSSGLLEAWRLFRLFKPNKVKTKHGETKLMGKGNKAREKGENPKSKEKQGGILMKGAGMEEEFAAESMVGTCLPEPAADDPTVLDDPNENQEENDFKRELLNSLNDLADVHERIKNIFLWRLPSTSRTYTTLLTFVIVLTIYLPTKYIVKIALFIVGLLYWHVIPIIAALPAPDRERLPPLFETAPTDAEYAMGLMSERIARGEDVRPPARQPPKKAKSRKTGDRKPNKATTSLITKGSGSVDWQKWGGRAEIMKTWATQGRKEENEDEDGGCEDSTGSTHTFVAHYKASPGTMTISCTALTFTPVTSARPRIRISLDDVRGVKKIGLRAIPGLSITWQRSPGSGSYNEAAAEAVRDLEIVEEKFWWVGGRDEVFARLVGWGGRKWLNV